MTRKRENWLVIIWELRSWVAYDIWTVKQGELSCSYQHKSLGNQSYDMTMSKYDFDYRISDLKTSIERTEG